MKIFGYMGQFSVYAPNSSAKRTRQIPEMWFSKYKALEEAKNLSNNNTIISERW